LVIRQNTFKNEVEIGGKILKIGMNVQKGIIVEIKIEGDYFSEKEAENLSSLIQNKRHFLEDVQQVMGNTEELIYSFF